MDELFTDNIRQIHWCDDLKEDLLFCKCVTNRATVDELFRIIDTWKRLVWHGRTVWGSAQTGLRLASKQLSLELNHVMTNITATVKYKTKTWKLAVLFDSESRRLSHGKCLSRVFELRDEMRKRVMNLPTSLTITTSSWNLHTWVTYFRNSMN